MTAEATRGIPVLSILSAGEGVIHARGDFRFSVQWIFLTSTWLILSALLVIASTVLENDWGPLSQAWLVVTVTGAVLLAILGPIAIVSARRSRRALEEFLRSFYPAWYKMKFEMFPIPEVARVSRMWELLSEIHPALAKAQPKFGANVEGKNGSHFFDLFVGRSGGSVLPSTPGPVGFARVFRGTGMTEKREVETLKQDSMDVARKRGANIAFIVAVSEVGFNPEALSWAASPEGLPTKNTTSALLVAAGDRLAVVWVG